ncbi:MAG TPA: PIG-L family deacetylase [Thermomicrobiales bacterium]|nr:PIG-L family deacetylase [Thermomicrobiales bacterium]
MTPTPGLDILFMYAHPDDESFGNGGTLAWARAAGHKVGLVCATRGEAGEISDPSLGPPSMLGATRERELRTAMDLAGVQAIRLLGYRDSGMAGTPENDDPRSLVQADHDELMAHVVFQLRDLRPRIVVTFGPDGGYGHPDHIRIGAAVTEGVEIAASEQFPWLGQPWRVDSLYWASICREDIQKVAAHGHPYFSRLTSDELNSIGTPREEITHVFDLRPYAADKVRIMLAHPTQLPFQPAPGSPFDPATRPNIGKESFRKIPLLWTSDEDEPDVFDRNHTANDDFVGL